MLKKGPHIKIFQTSLPDVLFGKHPTGWGNGNKHYSLWFTWNTEKFAAK